MTIDATFAYLSPSCIEGRNAHFDEFSGAVFVRNPINRELVATFEIIVSVHDNASDIIDMSVSIPNGKSTLF